MKDNFDLKKYLKDNEVMERSNKYVAATLNEGTKKDELREKIKDMVMAEMAGMGDSLEEEMTYEEDGVAEAKDDVEEDESEDIETEEEVDVVDTEDMPEDMPEEEDVVTDKGGIMSNLEAAMEKARELGDEKLIDQLGNTITFYTRQHISK